MRSGVLYAIAAYSLWGLVPLFFRELEPAGAGEVLAHRIIWSFVALALVLVVTRHLRPVLALTRDARSRRLLGAAAVFVAVNWGVYVYAVSTERVIEAALGYFISPLVSVAFGLAIFGERLSRATTGAVALGGIAVVILTTQAGGFPWIALALATSWGLYGAMKKLADAGAVEGLAVETLLLIAPALVLVVFLWTTGEGSFTDEGSGHTFLLIASGPVTVIPLALFSAGATRIPLSTAGLLQYLTPVIQFLIGWIVMGEEVPTGRWIGFGLVWLALVLLARDVIIRRSRRPRRAVRPCPPGRSCRAGTRRSPPAVSR